MTLYQVAVGCIINYGLAISRRLINLFRIARDVVYKSEMLSIIVSNINLTETSILSIFQSILKNQIDNICMLGKSPCHQGSKIIIYKYICETRIANLYATGL